MGNISIHRIWLEVLYFSSLNDASLKEIYQIYKTQAFNFKCKYDRHIKSLLLIHLFNIIYQRISEKETFASNFINFKTVSN